MSVITPPPPLPPPQAGACTQDYECQNSGECREVTTSVLGIASTSAMCKCEIGFAGDNCECVAPAHGDCTPTADSDCQHWTCSCYPGWTSSGNTAGLTPSHPVGYCDVQENVPPNGGAAAGCSPSPCQNGGTCASYTIMGSTTHRA
eukprot:SAG11_NODE_3694_length_2276_cov_1.344970_2_plen_146_part_00